MTKRELLETIVGLLNNQTETVLAAIVADHDDLAAVATVDGDGYEVQVRVVGKVPARSE